MKKISKNERCSTEGCRAEFYLVYLGKKLCDECWKKLCEDKENEIENRESFKIHNEELEETDVRMYEKRRSEEMQCNCEEQ